MKLIDPICFGECSLFDYLTNIFEILFVILAILLAILLIIGIFSLIIYLIFPSNEERKNKSKEYRK